MKTFVFEHLLSGNTIYSPGTVTIDDAGMIEHVGSKEIQGKEEIIKGFAVPGMPNLHSHAFPSVLF